MMIDNNDDKIYHDYDNNYDNNDDDNNENYDMIWKWQY